MTSQVGEGGDDVTGNGVTGNDVTGNDVTENGVTENGVTRCVVRGPRGSVREVGSGKFAG